MTDDNNENSSSDISNNTTFEDLNVNDNLIEALKKEKILSPTQIQVEAIPLILENKDIIASSDTGTGKTLAYLLPIIQRIDSLNKSLQVVILAPTYELVIQIQRQIERLLGNSGTTGKEIISFPIVGSSSVKRQIEIIKKRPIQIAVASSGRLLELINKKKIKMNNVKTIIIDEADRLVDDNNISQTKEIIKKTMRDRQILAFSATITDTAKKNLTSLIINTENLEIIKAKNINIVSEKIFHNYIICEKRDKIKVLRSLVHNTKKLKAIVFINKSEELEVFTDKLKHHNLKVDCLHGSWDKAKREKAIRDFTNDKINLLVASDVAARGLDFKGVTHIINIDIPDVPKIYLHRAGRTARAGAKGTTISIVGEYEVKILKKIEKKLKIEIKEI